MSPDNEIVWVYTSPYFNTGGDGRPAVYRAYRVPYEWIPQLTIPEEWAVIPPELSEFKIDPR